MKLLFSLTFLLVIISGKAQDSAALPAPSVIVIPYMPAMHLSDSDPDIAEESQMDLGEMRKSLRNDLIASLNKNFAEVYDVKSTHSDYVKSSDRDLDVIYHSLLFGSDSTYPSKYPRKFAVKDTSVSRLKDASKLKPEKQYINVSIADATLLPDLSEKYKADYFIFINELDIKTRFDDCLNLALKIYRRDLKVHYTIFDRNGKQVYGDVAVSHFESNANDVKEIAAKNFPKISDDILQSFKRAYTLDK